MKGDHEDDKTNLNPPRANAAPGNVCRAAEQFWGLCSASSGSLCLLDASPRETILQLGLGFSHFLLPVAHFQASLAQFHKSCTLPRTPSLAQISRVATTALGLTESISRPGCRKKTLSKEMTHIQKDFSCSCSHAFYFYCIFLQTLCLLTHTTGSTQSLCTLPVYRISKPLTGLPKGFPLSITQSSRKQRKKQYQSQVGLCASSPWDTTRLWEVLHSLQWPT